MPFSPDHINLWMIDDGDGWALIDTGLWIKGATLLWNEIFASVPDARRLTRVFVTHMHPDHAGMAGWLAREFGVRLWMTRLEYLACRAMTADTGREASPEGTAFYHRADWSAAAIESARVRFGHFGKYVHALPDSFRRLRDGEARRIGACTWRVIVGSGHSPEHACLYCAQLKTLISGDQVLPKISPNVSVYPDEPDADPMAGWYASLAKLKREVPDDVLGLPAHNACFRGLHARLDALEKEQDRAIERLRRALGEPRRVIDVVAALFAREIDETDVTLLGMATGESIACLNYLVHRGEARVRLDAGNVAWYRLVSACHRSDEPALHNRSDRSNRNAASPLPAPTGTQTSGANARCPASLRPG